MSEERAHLYFGGIAAEYEDVLVGNRAGLEELKRAIDEALECGESSVSAGEFLGVKCLETTEFTKNIRHKNTLGSKIGFALIGVAFILTVFMVWLSSK